MDEIVAIDALSALAHRTRLAVFRLLAPLGPAGLPAGEIARRVDVPATTMSTHLAILTRAGLIQPRRESRAVFYALDQGGVRALLEFLTADCCGGQPELCAGLHNAADKTLRSSA